MKSLIVFCLLAGMLLAINGCVKDRTANIDYYTSLQQARQDSFLKQNPGDTMVQVVVNEFSASGSTWVNADGYVGDWLELYNSSDSTIDFSKTNYYLTTDSTPPAQNSHLSVINKLSIPAKGFLVVSCNDTAAIGTQIFVNFHLSKSGSFIGLYKKASNGTYVTCTYHPFGPQASGVTEGLLPDGGAFWTNPLTPTPGEPNHL